MKIYQIELLDPKAKGLLDELVSLNLITLQELDVPKQEFKTLLNKLREKKGKTPTLIEISKEVEIVREERHAKGK